MEQLIATPQSKSKSKTKTGVGIIITKKLYTTPHHHHHHNGSFMKFSVNSHNILKLGFVGLPMVLQAKNTTTTTTTGPSWIFQYFFTQSYPKLKVKLLRLT